MLWSHLVDAALLLHQLLMLNCSLTVSVVVVEPSPEMSDCNTAVCCFVDLVDITLLLDGYCICSVVLKQLQDIS